MHWIMMIITKANDAWINGREDADTDHKKSTGDNATKTSLIAHINTNHKIWLLSIMNTKYNFI